MARDHMASFGIVGVTGRRIGTGYAYTPEKCDRVRTEPWFRFRRDEDRQHFADWQAKALSPTRGGDDR